MITTARRNGRLAYEFFDLESLFPEIASGYPVIFLQNLSFSWLPIWHYAVVVGYDTAQNYVILRSGTTSRKVMSFGVFEKTWARSNYWGIIILQPTQLPALAMEKTYLSSSVGFGKNTSVSSRSIRLQDCSDAMVAKPCGTNGGGQQLLCAW